MGGVQLSLAQSDFLDRNLLKLPPMHVDRARYVSHQLAHSPIHLIVDVALMRTHSIMRIRKG